MLPVILIGGGGHAKVLASTIQATGRPILGFVAPGIHEGSALGLPHLGDDCAVLDHHPAGVLLAHGVGSTRPGTQRASIFEAFKDAGYTFATVIHPAAIVAADAELGEGCVVFAGAVIQPGVKVGQNVIVNSSATIDHDCRIGPHAHIAPGAVLCGSVEIGEAAHVGAGSVVIQGLTVGPRSTVGAGSVVLRSVPADAVVLGNPGRLIPSRTP